MRIAIIGATGRAGREIAAELSRRGHQVTAISRHPDQTAALPGVTPVAGDANDVATLVPLISGHDAVVSAVMFHASDPEKLIAAVTEARVPRYLVVGGAGSLDAAPGLKVIDTPEFPEEYKAEAGAGLAFLERLRETPDLDWTFLSPSAVFFEGPRTGVFRLGTDQLLVSEAGSAISFADYAIAMADEIETPRHRRQRFTVGY